MKENIENINENKKSSSNFEVSKIGNENQ